MEKTTQYVTPYEFEGRLPLAQAVPLGLQHVLAMFVGNLTPILIITNLCAAVGDGAELAALQVGLLQNAMLVAGIVTLVQLYAVGPVGGKVPIIMGTSSGFIGVFQSVVNVMGGGVAAYAAIMGASILGGLFETVLGVFLKPLRRFFPAVVTGTVVLSIGLSLIGVGVGSFGGGTSAADYGSLENLLIGLAALVSIMPQSVLGGAAVIMFSSIVMSGIQLITREPLTPRSMSIVSVALGLGYGLGANSAVLAGLPQAVQLVFGGSGIVPAAFVAIAMNLLLPREKQA